MLRKFYDVPAPATDYMSRMNLHDYEILEKLKEDESFDIGSLLNAAPEIPDDPFADDDLAGGFGEDYDYDLPTSS
jgi:hypothetical protein